MHYFSKHVQFVYYFISYGSVIVWCTDNRYTHVNKLFKSSISSASLAGLSMWNVRVVQQMALWTNSEAHQGTQTQTVALYFITSPNNLKFKGGFWQRRVSPRRCGKKQQASLGLCVQTVVKRIKVRLDDEAWKSCRERCYSQSLQGNNFTFAAWGGGVVFIFSQIIKPVSWCILVTHSL